MKASELLAELQGRIAKDGDHDVAYYMNVDGTMTLTPVVSVWGMFKDNTINVETFALCNQDQHEFALDNVDSFV